MPTHDLTRAANGSITSRGGSSISVTSYNLPSVINAGSETSALAYGAFRNRFKQVTTGSDPTTTIYVAGILERVTRAGVTEFRHQIHGPTGPLAIYTRRSSGTADTYYLHQDHLGSPELVTNAAGAQVVKLSFAAFGERRGSSWTGTPSSGDWTAIGNTTWDGFTDHEHLDSVGLIHVNGRVYDPKIGRFLSKDLIVHLGLSQSPNSYGYVWNNPLRFVDPFGWDPSPVLPEIRVVGGRWRTLTPQQARDTLNQLSQQRRSTPTGNRGGSSGRGRDGGPDGESASESEEDDEDCSIFEVASDVANAFYDAVYSNVLSVGVSVELVSGSELDGYTYSGLSLTFNTLFQVTLTAQRGRGLAGSGLGTFLGFGATAGYQDGPSRTDSTLMSHRQAFFLLGPIGGTASLQTGGGSISAGGPAPASANERSRMRDFNATVGIGAGDFSGDLVSNAGTIYVPPAPS